MARSPANAVESLQWRQRTGRAAACLVGERGGQFVAAPHPEFHVGAVQVAFHCPHGHHQPLGNIPVGEALDSQLHDVLFPSGQANRGCRRDELALPEPLAQFVVAFLPKGNRLAGTPAFTRSFQNGACPGVGFPCNVDEPFGFKPGRRLHEGISVRGLPMVGKGEHCRGPSAFDVSCQGMHEGNDGMVAQVPTECQEFQECS